MRGIPPEVAGLVQRFACNREAYRSPSYNEAQTRREFIDPLFRALAWDMDNEQGLAEAYKDVIHEDAIKVGGATKAPDYCFRIGGTRKFFVEAKKPAVGLDTEPEPAYQLRRYAWTSKLPLSVLTDFEEFAVYDCRIKPQPTDKPATARVFYCTCDEYADKWEWISGLFSKDAILKGAFDKYAESNKRKRGTAEVDAEFLREIEHWRELLAQNFALRNPQLSVRDLNFAVQRTIDRIVFLRMCEDRGIELYGGLQALLNGDRVYERLATLFRRADEKYNSGLFYFTREAGREPPDTLTLGLALDDRVLKDIIKSLYYPESPYEFSVLPPEILGQVYEQFLGKVIRLTAGHRAKVEEKPEVRKAGGVYYTPAYIVDYIVKNTVGKLLEGKTPGDIAPDVAADPRVGRRVASAPRGRRRNAGARIPSRTPGSPGIPSPPLRILDPACGSGSFLLGAYQHLLNWYRDWYVAAGGSPAECSGRPPSRPSGAAQSKIYQGPGGQWLLTIQEKKRILLNHIYAVDIDPQAVETTKLSLLLKVLEGETEQTLGSTLRLFHERALPDLDKNIKCGNSLIGPDFYDGQQMTMFDEEERLRINVFDWAAEFPAVFPTGSPSLLGRGQGEGRADASGFDAVIGNPPYIRMEAFKKLKDYLRTRYSVHDERTDLYAYFIEREHALLRDGGRFGMIVSNKFLRANYGAKVRQGLLKAATVDRILDLAGLPVFRGATVRTVVLITTKGSKVADALYSPPPGTEAFLSVEGNTRSLSDVCDPLAQAIPQRQLTAKEWRLAGGACTGLVERLRAQSRPLLDCVGGRVCRGIVSGLTAAFVITDAQRREIVSANPEAREIIHPFVQGRNVRRYFLAAGDAHLIYTHHGIDMRPYPGVIEHLKPFRKQLEKRATKQEWYELQQPQLAYKELLEQPKIVFPDIATECRFTLDRARHFGANTVYFLPTDDLILLGILNSRVAQFYFTQTCAGLEGRGQTYLRFFGQYLEGFPVRTLDQTARSGHDRLVALVRQMLDLHKDLAAAKTPEAKNALQRQIDATDRQIDQLVYELYRLTEEEIKIVEEATR